ncbi:MAG TPA: 5-formyltetrahydrofolate cyclo-ligase [Gammaproteobacteria bacterium]|nr:5-formyltetrahydrofolate cyclo-ligase [Gammaproteobacteria bacterium]
MISNNPSDRQALRTRLCRRREALTATARATASAAIVQCIRNLSLFRQARHVALYSAIRGEVDLQALWHDAPTAKYWYLPAIDPGPERAMRFIRHEAAAILSENFYGIPEPAAANATVREPHELDLVFVPLVAFDTVGNRIGMGAGYYDRAFAFLRAAAPPERPRLIGVGYDFQRVEHIDTQPWDVPLTGVITEKTLYCRIKEGGE